MAYNTVAIKKDIDGKPVPQHFNKVENKYEPSTGFNGLQKVILCDGNGEPLNVENINNNTNTAINGILVKLDELIGVVNGGI